MELVLKELGNERVIRDASLRKRARECAKISFTRHYLVLGDDREVAYLAIDYLPGLDYILLYELFVKEAFRRKGVGSQLLKTVEKLARESGYKKVALHPESFEKGIPKESIKNWYVKHGYQPSVKIKNALEKSLYGDSNYQ